MFGKLKLGTLVFLFSDLNFRKRRFLRIFLQAISFARTQQTTSGEYINLLDFQTEQVSNIVPTYFRLSKTCSTLLLDALALVYSAASFVSLAVGQFALIMLPLGTFIRKSTRSSTEIIRQRASVTVGYWNITRIKPKKTIRSINSFVVKQIANELTVPLTVDGGVRDLKTFSQ